MISHSSNQRPLHLPLALAFALVILLLGGSPSVAADKALKTSTTQVTIPAHGDITLAASVIKPTTGTWPLIVMPGTFAAGLDKLEVIARQLAARGYTVVAYNERGFGKSGGLIDAGGPDDVQDASDVLDWALDNVPVDDDRVAITSLSLGAGFIPMVAARDHRFKAGAMLSGWGDMWAGLYPNRTGAFATNKTLKFLADRDRPSPAFDDFFDRAIKNDFPESSRKFALERSPLHHLDQIATNPVPMYMSTSLNEMIWPVDQTLAFYEAYPGPKHLDMLPGDHATSESASALGATPATWASAMDWFDHYVKGLPATPTMDSPIRVVSRDLGSSNPVNTDLFTDWPFEARSTLDPGSRERLYLATKPNWYGLGQTTQLSTEPGPQGKRLIQGSNLLLNGGLPMYQGLLEIFTGMPSTVPLTMVDQRITGTWIGPKLESRTRIRGATRVHLDLTPTTATGSTFAYLIARDALNRDFVVGFKPYTWTGATPGEPMDIDFDIPFQAFNVPAGSRLVVAVSTDDVLFSSNTPKNSSMLVGPGSYIDLPLK